MQALPVLLAKHPTGYRPMFLFTVHNNASICNTVCTVHLSIQRMMAPKVKNKECIRWIT